MNAEQRLEVLEELLRRVRANTRKPRDHRAVMAQVPVDQADLGSAEELELLDEDIVEIETIHPPEAEADTSPHAAPPPKPGGSAEPPASSSRRLTAATMDEALVSAAEQAQHDSSDFDEGREVPIKTPPPESGPQSAPKSAVPPALDELEEEVLEEVDLDEEMYELDEAEAAGSGPTTEQLGQTIDLEEGEQADLEVLSPPLQSEPRPAQPEELEAPMPRSVSAGAYDESLAPPPEALQDLERRRQREPAAPEVTERSPVSSEEVAELSGDRLPAEPTTFLQVLDQALRLTGGRTL